MKVLVTGLGYHINARSNKNNAVISFIKRLITHLRYPFTQKHLDNLEEKLYSRYPLDKSNKCMIFYPLNRRYSTKCFDSTRIVEMQGDEVCIPMNSELFLTERYGNYLEYLPIKERFNEFYKMYYVVKERQMEYMKSNE